MGSTLREIFGREQSRSAFFRSLPLGRGWILVSFASRTVPCGAFMEDGRATRKNPQLRGGQRSPTKMAVGGHCGLRGQEPEKPSVRGTAPKRDAKARSEVDNKASGGFSESPIVCFCHCVTEKQIREAIQDGCRTIVDLQAELLCSTGCGGCASDVERIFKEERKE